MLRVDGVILKTPSQYCVPFGFAMIDQLAANIDFTRGDVLKARDSYARLSTLRAALKGPQPSYDEFAIGHIQIEPIGALSVFP